MLQVSLDGGVLRLVLDRPDKRNALAAPMIDALHGALERADLDAEVRVVLVTANGPDFCAGADLEELLASASNSPSANEAAALRLGDLFLRCRALPKPVVAAVHGRALAGGAGLALSADIVIADQGAQVGYPEIRRGFVPAMVMTQLRRHVGEKLAMDLVLTGRLLSAEEALAAGLVSRVVPEGQLEEVSGELCRTLAAAGPSALGLTKQLFYELDDLPFGEGIRQGARVNAAARSTPEFATAIASFLKA